MNDFSHILQIILSSCTPVITSFSTALIIIY